MSVGTEDLFTDILATSVGTDVVATVIDGIGKVEGERRLACNQ